MTNEIRWLCFSSLAAIGAEDDGLVRLSDIHDRSPTLRQSHVGKMLVDPNLENPCLISHFQSSDFCNLKRVAGI